MAEIFEVRICRITEYFMLMNILKYVSNYDPKPVKQYKLKQLICKNKTVSVDAMRVPVHVSNTCM